MRKSTKRKHYTPTAPSLPLTEQHARDLALRAHLAAATISDQTGVNAFVNILTTATIAMEHAKKHDDYSRTMLRSAVFALEDVIKKGRITDTQEKLIQKVAGLLDEWVDQGRITYAGLVYAKRVMRE